jgi:hypothetical protein
MRRKPRWVFGAEAHSTMGGKGTLTRPAWFATLPRDQRDRSGVTRVAVLIGSLDCDTVMVVASETDLLRLKGTVDMALASMRRQRGGDNA